MSTRPTSTNVLIPVLGGVPIIRRSVKPPVRIFRMRLRALNPNHDGDDVRHLRAILKIMLRHGFRAIEIKPEHVSEEPGDE
jgi:hypothetical protein